MTEEILYRVPLDNGDVVFVRPVSFFARQGILDKGRELFPDPDPESYQVMMKNAPEGVEAFEPLEDNAEYQTARIQMMNGRLQHMRESILDLGAVVDCEEGREAMIERYAPQLETLRQMANGVPADDWIATVKMCAVSTGDDIRRIWRVASQALEQEEIRAGVELFRREIQRTPAATNHRREKSPGTRKAAGGA